MRTGAFERTSNCMNDKLYFEMIAEGWGSKKEQFNASHCWWCTYPFDTLPVCAPVNYDTLKDVFHVHGVFCSFECAKTYLVDRKSSYVDTSLVTLLNKRLTGKLSRIRCAPSRLSLQRFGGHMTIDEFRAHSATSNLDHVTKVQTMKYNCEVGAVKSHVEPPKNYATISAPIKSPTGHPFKFDNVPQPLEPKPRCVEKSESVKYTRMSDTPMLLKEEPKVGGAKKDTNPSASLENWMGLVIKEVNGNNGQAQSIFGKGEPKFIQIT